MGETVSAKRWMSVKEVAEYIGMSERTIYNQTGPKSKNPLPLKPRRFGRKLIRFDKQEVDRYMENQ